MSKSLNDLVITPDDPEGFEVNCLIARMYQEPHKYLVIANCIWKQVSDNLRQFSCMKQQVINGLHFMGGM
ncbi:MAG: hypothetical protein RMY31_026485 [Dendronalium sp. ChiSLP03b]|nr:hypothetical protein [Dendronalium sp. ChiSLP03b]MDZ8205862.1 hypothetical protein [Dendronalium sp. ChiSLP03b]